MMEEMTLPDTLDSPPAMDMRAATDLATLEAADKTPELSSREKQVAVALAYGLTNRETADQLGISPKTIDTHRGHILKKLRVRNNVELAREMLRRGVTTL